MKDDGVIMGSAGVRMCAVEAMSKVATQGDAHALELIATRLEHKDDGVRRRKIVGA